VKLGLTHPRRRFSISCAITSPPPPPAPPHPYHPPPTPPPSTLLLRFCSSRVSLRESTRLQRPLLAKLSGPTPGDTSDHPTHPLTKNISKKKYPGCVLPSIPSASLAVIASRSAWNGRCTRSRHEQRHAPQQRRQRLMKSSLRCAPTGLLLKVAWQQPRGSVHTAPSLDVEQHHPRRGPHRSAAYQTPPPVRRFPLPTLFTTFDVGPVLSSHAPHRLRALDAGEPASRRR